MGTCRKPPSAILWTATATVSSLADDDRVGGHVLGHGRVEGARAAGDLLEDIALGEDARERRALDDEHRAALVLDEQVDRFMDGGGGRDYGHPQKAKGGEGAR